MKYSDILIEDYSIVGNDILESFDGLGLNNGRTRCIIKWDGDNPSWVVTLGLTVRDHTEARAYYGDYANGWILIDPGI